MSSSQDPVLVNDGSSTEMCGTKSSDKKINLSVIIYIIFYLPDGPQRHLPRELSISSLFSPDNPANSNLILQGEGWDWLRWKVCRRGGCKSKAGNKEELHPEVFKDSWIEQEWE